MDANMMLYDVTKHHMAILIFLELESGPGKRRDLLHHIPSELLQTADGYDDIYKILDKEDIKEDYVKADDAAMEFERTRRIFGQRKHDY